MDTTASQTNLFNLKKPLIDLEINFLSLEISIPYNIYACHSLQTYIRSIFLSTWQNYINS